MDMLEVTKKRFIAGAVCPECNEVDRIVVEVAQHSESLVEMSRRRCVSCGFADEYAEGAGTPVSGIPKGRPERPKSAAVNPVQVRILDPNDPSL